MSNNENDEFIKIKKKIAGYYEQQNEEKNATSIQPKQVSPSSPSSTKRVRSNSTNSQNEKELGTSSSWMSSTSSTLETNQDDELTRIKRKIANMEISCLSEDSRKLPPKVPSSVPSSKQNNETEMNRIKKRIAGLTTDDQDYKNLLPPSSANRIRSSSSNSINSKTTSEGDHNCDDIVKLKHRIANLSSDTDDSPNEQNRTRNCSYDEEYRRIKQKIAGISTDDDVAIPQSSSERFSNEFSTKWTVPVDTAANEEMDPFSVATKQKMEFFNTSPREADYDFLDFESPFRCAKQELVKHHRGSGTSSNDQQLSTQSSSENVAVSSQRQRLTHLPGAYAISSTGNVNARQMPQKMPLPMPVPEPPPPPPQIPPLVEQIPTSPIPEQQTIDIDIDNTSFNDMPTSTAEVETPKKRRYPRRKVIIILSSILILLTIIILSIFLTKPPCCAPPPTNYTQRYNELYSALSTISDPKTFTKNTNQSKALNWMVYNDTTTNTSSVTVYQRYILVLFYYSTNGPTSWFNTKNWLSSVNECDWYGIKCNDTNVTVLYLVDNGVQYSLPSEITFLTSLQLLFLSKNSITGSIHSNINNLVNLQFLYLDNNDLSNTIPMELFSLNQLRELVLDHNNLIGSIFQENATDLSTSLQILRLYNNQLSNTIPTTIDRFVNLRQLFLDGNEFVGGIPSSISNLKKLTEFGTRYNELTGGLPESICDLNALRGLYLSFNWLSGYIPPCIGNLTSLLILDLDFNRLSGLLPPTLGNLSNLTALSLNDNYFSGTIPSDLGQLTNLSKLSLNANDFAGSLPIELCDLSLSTFTFDCTLDYSCGTCWR